MVLGVFAFAGLRWGLRAWWGDNKVFQPLETVAANFAPVLALIFGVMAGLSFWLKKRCERLVDQQTSLESLRAVSWKDFELLVAEAYRRQGYEVDFSLGKGTDGAWTWFCTRLDAPRWCNVSNGRYFPWVPR